MHLTAPIYRLKRAARLLARSEGIALHAALDQVARREGFASWSQLAAHHAKRNPATRLFQTLAPGDMVLLAARPGQGKTVLGLDLARQAAAQGDPAFFFTLDATAAEVERLCAGLEDQTACDLIAVDTSEGIAADHILARVSGAPTPAFVVVDYLQLLDQRRSDPALQAQMTALRRSAKTSGTRFVFLSQVQRHFESSDKSMPDAADIRLPNPLDLSVFDTLCFVHEGAIQFRRAA